MMKKKIVINGESWCKNVTGIERVATEVTQILDRIVKPNEFELMVPSGAKNLPIFKNIKIINSGCTPKPFVKWTQIDFQKYIIKNKAISLDFSNTCPVLTPGIAFLHDIYCKLYPQDFKSQRDKLVRAYSNFMYKTISKRALKIITVSEYSKQTIIDTYHINPEKIAVIYNGIGSFNEIIPDFSIFERLPKLSARPFYFTLGSLSLRKNLKWIAEHAELYPDEVFAVSGKALMNVIPNELEKLRRLPNVLMTGYLSDGEVKALMKKCKAFIFPSYFEGFGLPPLEALSCGASIIISNTSCLPEIYGNTAHYIDPFNPEVDLNVLLEEKVSPPDEILKKYTLENSASKLYEVIKDTI